MQCSPSTRPRCRSRRRTASARKSRSAQRAVADSMTPASLISRAGRGCLPGRHRRGFSVAGMRRRRNSASPISPRSTTAAPPTPVAGSGSRAVKLHAAPVYFYNARARAGIEGRAAGNAARRRWPRVERKQRRKRADRGVGDASSSSAPLPDAAARESCRMLLYQPDQQRASKRKALSSRRAKRYGPIAAPSVAGGMRRDALHATTTTSAGSSSSTFPRGVAFPAVGPPNCLQIPELADGVGAGLPASTTRRRPRSTTRFR